MPRQGTELSIATSENSSSTPDFRLLFESITGLYLILLPDLRIAAVSDDYLRATMTIREEIVGRHIFDVFPDNPEDPAATGTANLRASLERVLRTRCPDAMAVQKYDIRRPESEGNGFEVRYWSPVNTPILDADGNLVYINHRAEDVTDFIRLKQQEYQQLQETEALRTHAEAMEAEIFVRAQQIQEANRQLRLANEELALRYKSQTSNLEESHRILRAREEQLQQAQKLEVVGRLAGGIAHDFNNLLTAISVYTEMALLSTELGEEVRSDLSEVQKAVQRATSLSRQLLAFSRKQVIAPQRLDLRETVTGIHGMLRRLIREDIDLVTVAAPAPTPILADPSQIEQILTNLVVNARDAMPDSGQITIETQNITLDAGYVSEHVLVEAGEYVLLAVSDTGQGMDGDTMQHVFEPFFTTKEVGKGTGLGLSTVYGIVRQSGGHIQVYSEPGVGATFKIYFPRADGPTTSPTAANNGVQALPKGFETILLVEDDAAVRAVTRGILEKSGYAILEASNGEQALQIIERHTLPIHLLLTDLVMPQMSGRPLVEQAMALRPTLKVVYMSGYTDDAVVRHGVLTAQMDFLQKPFTALKLAQKVREVLDR